MQKLLIGNAGGFWGDRSGAALQLVRQQPDLDYLTMDYLAELSLSIMAVQRDKDPQMGYARDFIEVMRSLAIYLKDRPNLKVVTNAGGLNPLGCAHACWDLLQELDCSGIKLGVVTGDDVLPTLLKDSEEPLYHHLETQQPLTTVSDQLVTANGYLGAQPIVAALKGGAQVVITGRVADPSLTVGPCVAHFGWKWDDYARIAGATIAGHLIECGTQVTGGISTDWLSLPDIAQIGFPVVEVDEEGRCIVTKPPKTGGRVTVEIVKEQLLYEIGDPARYLSPDVTVSFLDLVLETAGVDRVAVQGAIGAPPPSTYKVSACYRHGFRAEGQLLLFGPQANLKARRCGEIILERMRLAGYEPQESLVECLGAGDCVPGLFPAPEKLLEVVLRIAVADSRRAVVERFTQELAPLVTSGPQGITGYATGRPKVRPRFGYWPCLIERRLLEPSVEVL